MGKVQKTTVLVLIALSVAIAGLTVGFAAFSTNLMIHGTGTVRSSNWEVRFENLKPVALTGSAQERTTPTLNTNDTSIMGYDVTLLAPGDSASYTFDIANNGTFDAEITSIVIPIPTCTGTGEQATTDASNVCNNLTYTLKYSDGTDVKIGDHLASQEKKMVKLTLTYDSSIATDLLPSNDVAVNNLGISILYSQD